MEEEERTTEETQEPGSAPRLRDDRVCPCLPPRLLHQSRSQCSHHALSAAPPTQEEDILKDHPSCPLWRGGFPLRRHVRNLCLPLEDDPSSSAALQPGPQGQETLRVLARSSGRSRLWPGDPCGRAKEQGQYCAAAVCPWLARMVQHAPQMYSWLVSPESLNPGYRNWITGASRVPPAILPWVVARHKRTDQEPPLEQAYKILTRRDITPFNASKVEAIIDSVQKGDYGVAFPPCEMVHPWADSCLWTEVLRFKDVFALMAPVYAGLHLIPPLLFKRKQFMKDPLPLLLKSVKGTIRSGCFISTFVCIFQSLVCFRHQTWWFGQTLPKPLRALWLTKYYYWVLGATTCLSLFIEEKKRRGELAMYVMPKALEAAWSIARRRAYVPFIPGGEVLLTSAALSMVMSTYQHEPGMLSGLVRTIMYQFVGHD